ncbi:threonine/serine exporter family protein [Caldicellulosiruptoraceae bacterium PP1]
MINFLVQVIAACLASIFFAVLYNAPKRILIICGISGGIGWGVYLYFLNLTNSNAVASFFAALSVNILAEIFARIFKAPVPLFLIPGIIPFVPGAGTYNTMTALIKNQTQKAIEIGTQTLLIAGSIAVALMFVSSFNKISIKKRKA